MAKGKQIEKELLQNQALERSNFLSFYVEFVREHCKNCHGALVGLTNVKGTSVDNFFLSFRKIRNTVSGDCRSYLCKR